MKKIILFTLLVIFTIYLLPTASSDKIYKDSIKEKNIKGYNISISEKIIRKGEKTQIGIGNQSNFNRVNIYYYKNDKKVLLGELSTLQEEPDIHLSFSSEGKKKISFDPLSDNLKTKNISLKVIDEYLDITKFNVSKKSTEKNKKIMVNTTIENYSDGEKNFYALLKVGKNRKYIEINKSIKKGKEKIEREISISKSKRTDINLITPEISSIKKKTKIINKKDQYKKKKTFIRKRDLASKSNKSNYKSNKSNIEVIDLSINKSEPREYEKIKLTAKVKNRMSKDVRETFLIETVDKREIKYFSTKFERNSIETKKINFSLKNSGLTTIRLVPLRKKMFKVNSKRINVSKKVKGLFSQNLLPHFNSPPKNTKDINRTLYEDLDGDGSSTDIYPTSELLLELSFNRKSFIKNMEDKKRMALDWNKDGKLDQKDMIELYKKQKILKTGKRSINNLEDEKIYKKLIDIAISR